MKFVLILFLTLSLFSLHITKANNLEEIYSNESDSIPVDDECAILLDKDVQIDFKKLQALIVYPEMAKRAGIEGKVIVKIYIDSNGKMTNSVIFKSANDLLNISALNAIKKYADTYGFEPAILNEKKVETCLYVPFTYKLANSDTQQFYPDLNITHKKLLIILMNYSKKMKI